MNTEDETENGREKRKASLHLSPMIRLVMQNAHEVRGLNDQYFVKRLTTLASIHCDGLSKYFAFNLF
jgi:hypothetical protein